MKRRWVRVVAVVIGLAATVGGVSAYRATKSARAEATAIKAAADRPVPVAVATVSRQDIPLVLDGLGSVTPLQTVTVKSQVDGRLDRIPFKEGDSVKSGDLLAQVDPRPYRIKLHEAEAALAKDRAVAKNSETTAARIEKLQAEGLASQQQLDDARAQAATQRANMQADQTQIEAARLQLDYASVKSPIEGVAGIRLVDPGNIVRANDTSIVVVTQLDPIAVVFTLPQDALPRVASAQGAGEVNVEVWSRDGSTKLGVGKLAVVDNQVAAATGTIRLKAVLPNAKRTLWPSAFVKARIVLEVRKNALTAPATAVQRGPNGNFAYVVGADQIVAMRSIDAEIQGDTALITKGLADGDRVVVEGQDQLRPGVRVAERSATPPAKGGPRNAGGDVTTTTGNPHAQPAQGERP